MVYGAEVAVCSQIIQNKRIQCGQSAQILSVEHVGARNQ
jgi:hypothetical protein